MGWWGGSCGVDGEILKQRARCGIRRQARWPASLCPVRLEREASRELELARIEHGARSAVVGVGRAFTETRLPGAARRGWVRIAEVRGAIVGVEVANIPRGEER